MLKRTKIMMALMVCTVACFANTVDDIRAYQAEGIKQAASVAKKTIDHQQAMSERTQLSHQTLINETIQLARHALPAKKQAQVANGAILFVSFSMPEPLLFALADEAAALKIPVVINGLVDGDFKKTIETFAHLSRKAKKQKLMFKGVSIDPIWFQQFQITSVPALVVTERPANCLAQTLCAAQPFDVVYGNASLKKGLSLIADKGEAASLLARTILEQGHV